MKLKLSERERWLLLATTIVVVFYVFYTFLLTPVSTQIGSQQQKLSALKLDLRVAEEKAKLLQKLELMPLQTLRAKRNKEEQVIDALNYISKTISKLDLTLLSIRPRLTEQSVGSAKVIFIDLAFSAGYNKIYQFMGALEKLPILILVDSMTMSRGSGQNLSVSMVVSVYY